MHYSMLDPLKNLIMTISVSGSFIIFIKINCSSSWGSLMGLNHYHSCAHLESGQNLHDKGNFVFVLYTDL